jgi:ADP-heptose:LPS heptosyltransferase
MTVLERLPERERVCFIRLRSLGDCVLTTPAIGLLKTARPDLHISVVAEPPYRAVFEHNPAVSQIVEPSWQSVRKSKPYLAINLHGGTRSQWMMALSGARWRAGFANHNVTLAYNFKIPRAQRVLGVNRTVHTAEHLASAVFALGVPVQDVPRAFLGLAPPPVVGDAASIAAKAPVDLNVGSRYAVLHPFAPTPEKRWPPERYCELARYLKLWNIEPIFLASPADDASAFAPHKVFAGTLSEVKTILAKATLFVGNDSGPAHMAAAFGVPSLVLFGRSNPAIWGPWRTESEVVVALEGLDQVSVSRVIAALERLRTLEEAHA